MIDFHIHTNASPDAKQALGEAVNKARELKMSHIAITDHYEFMEGEYYKNWVIKDFKAYGESIDFYNQKYDDITILKGIEIGHIDRKKDEIKKVLDSLDFDFVISSAHFTEDLDLYFPEYFQGKSKHTAYYNYLKEIRDSIDIMDDRVCVIGHIGYIAKYAPYDDSRLLYEDFSEIIDDILTRIIKRGFGIEINTANFGKKLNETMPPSPIIKRYRQLGGEIVTIGSDAHYTQDVGKAYYKAKQTALDAGFTHASIFKNLKQEYIPF